MKKRILATLFFVMLFIVFSSITSSADEIESVALPYVVEEGTEYYESSLGFGSGRCGIVNEENIYTTTPCYSAINGYSFLDAEGRIIDYRYEESANDIYVPEAPEGTVEIFLHFKTANYRNGWVDSKSIIARNEEAYKDEEIQVNNEVAKPEQVVEEIQTYTREGKSAIIIDYSGSMSDHQRKVVELLGKLQFDENTTVIVFGDTYQMITTEQLANEDFNVGYSTHMYQALNAATSLGVEQIIIISDLGTYDDVKLESSEELESVIIYDPLGIEDGIEREIRETWKDVDINRRIIR